MADKPDQRTLNRMAGEALLRDGQQADMFGEDGAVVPVERRAGPGRPAGAGNKVKTKLREYMAGQGYRDPAVQLAMLAGLDRPDLHPLGYAAQIAEVLGVPVTDVAREMRQASDALMPYWHAKITPDVAVTAPAVNILMAGPGGAVALSVPGAADPFAPLDVRMAGAGQIQSNQQVADGTASHSDAAIRTGEVSD